MSNKINLNGNWKYFRDPEGIFSVDEFHNIIKDEKSLESMNIPINWELAGLHNFNGTVWFIKNFDNNSAIEGISLLHFLGVDYFAEVWLNGNFLGKHEGYFSPFFFDVSKILDKKNTLVVKVTSPFEKPGETWPDKKRTIKGIFSHHDCRPGGSSKEYGQDQNTGGIWNDIFIDFGYNIVLEKVKIIPSLNNERTKAAVLIDLNYCSSEISAKEVSVNFKITTPDKKSLNKNETFLFQQGNNKISYLFEIDSPFLWWSWDLGEANLYYLKISSDYFSTKENTFGIRDVFLGEKQQFFINGKKLFLRGTNIIPTQFLSDFTNDKIIKVVSLMREANINIVRVHAHVNRKEFYDECDRQGIIVWQDFSLQWTYDESLSFKSEAVKQIKEMVNHLYNHASIAVWCCHNEPGNQIKTLDPLLEKAVLNEDSTRIVRRASNYEEHAYDGWYWGNKEHYAAAPMGPLATEFGAQGLPNKNSLTKIVGKENLFPPNWKVWEYHNFQVDQTFNIAKVEIGNSIETFIENSQSYQSELLKTAIDFYRRKRFDGINGIFQFMLIDCWPSITWSVVDYFGEKKKAYETLKECYEPIYISINLRQDQYFPGKKFLFDIFIINDLYKKYEDCILKFSINEKVIGTIENISLEENQITFINYELINLLVPSSLIFGKHKMELELIKKDTGEKISKNYFDFSIVQPI
ncbi:MAG: beta-galactosidase [Bacteroidetes bacterium]|nr:beta-galactosidase [Bacteroidota bacterium]